MTAAHTCPICREAVQRHPDNPSFPFCGARCKLADLGNWLGERYVVPEEPFYGDPEDDDPTPSLH